jgi:hypothetical protein
MKENHYLQDNDPFFMKVLGVDQRTNSTIIYMIGQQCAFLEHLRMSQCTINIPDCTRECTKIVQQLNISYIETFLVIHQ